MSHLPSWKPTFHAQHSLPTAIQHELLQTLDSLAKTHCPSALFQERFLLGVVGQSCEIEGVAELAEVPLVRDIAGWFLSYIGCSDALREDTLMLFEEAISNIVRHSYESSDEKWFACRIAREESLDASSGTTPWVLSIVCRDRGEKGRVSDLGARIAAIPKEGRPPLRRGGMGLYLMVRMMDVVRFTPGGDYNMLELQKNVVEESKS